MCQNPTQNSTPERPGPYDRGIRCRALGAPVYASPIGCLLEARSVIFFSMRVVNDQIFRHCRDLAVVHIYVEQTPRKHTPGCLNLHHAPVTAEAATFRDDRTNDRAEELIEPSSWRQQLTFFFKYFFFRVSAYAPDH